MVDPDVPKESFTVRVKWFAPGRPKRETTVYRYICILFLEIY